jgi:hypothetical protein
VRLRTAAPVAILIVLAGLLCLVLVRYALAAPQGDGTASAAREVDYTDVNPFGANFFLDREVEPWKRERTVQMAAQAGLGYARQQFAWAEIEPAHKGEFVDPATLESRWTKFDRIVDLYRANGIEVIARLDRAPAWARPVGSRPETPPGDFGDYGDFVYAFVSHFRGRIRYIQIWNEPNIYPEWGEQAVDPAAYTEMLKVAYQRAKEADPNVLVLSAPLAITLGEPHPEPGKWRSMPDTDYLEAMYQAGAGAYFDILSANAFGFDLPPTDPPSEDVLNFQRVVLQREIMERYGDEEKAVWFNEYGWNAAPAGFEEEQLTWKRVSEEEQAEYTLQGIELAREEWPWAGVFNVWYFRQTGQQYSPYDAAYYFRMVDTDFTPRRVYDAVQDATRSLFVAVPGYYEETNPAVSADEGWRLAVDPSASGQALLETQEEGASVTFAFQGSSLDLIARTGPDEGRLLITHDGRNVPGLPVDGQGRSYIDLQSESVEWQASLPIASGIGAGQHVVRLTLAEGGEAAPRATVDAFVVKTGERPPFPGLPVAGLALGLAAMAGLIVVDRRRRSQRAKIF